MPDVIFRGVHAAPQGPDAGPRDVRAQYRSPMMKRILVMSLMVFGLAFVLSATGCKKTTEEEGAAESAGQQVDEAAEEAGEQVEEAAEEAGDALEGALGDQ